MPKYPLQLPPLADENDFEKLINKLCQKKYNLDSFQLYGRKGSKQFGIDGITLSDGKELIVFQAKKKEDNSKSTRDKLLKEFEEETKQFNKEFVETRGYKVKEFIFASTVKRYTQLQDKAIELSKKYNFRVSYWGWDDISNLLHEYEDVFDEFYGYTKRLNPIKTKELFQKNSSILLASRNLFISKNYISIPELEKINKFIDSDNQEDNILVVVGKAGIGKTALLSEVQHRLKDKDSAYISIKSDQISLDSKNALSKQFEVENLHQSIMVLSQKEPLTIIIDQLDALSLTLSSNRDALNYMLEFIESLKGRDNINLVLSVREYDLNNDPLLKQIDDSNKIRVSTLSIVQVTEVLKNRQIDSKKLSSKLNELLTTPLYLALFLEVYSSTESYRKVQSIQDLYELFWKKRVVSNIGELREERVRDCIYTLAHKMDEKQKIEIPKLFFEDNYNKELELLISRNIVTLNGKKIKFFHQTFYDYVFARDFVSSEKSLFEYITSRHQGLSIREQVKQIIEFLRGTDEDEYLEQIRLFLFEDKVHLHFKLLVISYLGAIDNPTESEFELLEELFEESRDNLLYFLESWISIGWMSYFVDGGYFSKEYLEDERVGHRLKYKPINFVNQNSHRMFEIVEDFPNIKDKSSLIFRMLYDLDSWDDYTISIFERYEEESKQSHEDSIYTYTDFLEKISKSNIDYSIDKFFKHLDEKLSSQIEIDVDKRDLIDRKELDLIKNFIEKEPLNVLILSLNFLENILIKSVKKESGTYFLFEMTFFSMSQFGYGLYNVWKFYKVILDELIVLSKNNKQQFLKLLTPYKDTRYKVLLGLYILGCKEEYQLFLDEIYYFLTNHKLMENVEFNEDIGFSLLKLLEKTFDFYSEAQQKIMIETIMTVVTKSRFKGIDSFKYNRYYRGYKKYQLLLQIPKEKLKKFGVYKDFQELSRKFDWYKEKEPNKTEFRRIGAPLIEDAYKRMSFDNWKQSMRIYGLNRRDRKEHDLRGGKIEHSREFETALKENPHKFYDFLLTLKDDLEIQEDYLSSGLNALVEAKYKNEKIAKVIIKFSDSQDSYLNLSIIRAIHYLAYQDYFDEKFIDILISCKDIEYEGIVRDKEYESIQDNMTSSINSVQGVLAETLADIFKFTKDENRIKITLLIQELIESGHEYVIFGLLRRLGTIAKVDEPLYIELIFKILSRDEVGKITLYLMDVLHIFLNKKTIDFEIFTKYVEKSLAFINNYKEEEDYQQQLGQILFYHYLSTREMRQKGLLDKSIDISSNILSGVISQAFYEIQSDDTDRVKIAKEYIIRYKDSKSASWNMQFSMEKLHKGSFIENDLTFIKEIATSVETRRESHDFWDYLKNEFYAKKSRAEKILEVVEVFIDAYQKDSEDFGYKNEEKIEFIMELYGRFKTEKSKEKVLDILEKFLKNDSFRNVVQDQLDR